MPNRKSAIPLLINLPCKHTGQKKQDHKFYTAEQSKIPNNWSTIKFLTFCHPWKRNTTPTALSSSKILLQINKTTHERKASPKLAKLKHEKGQGHGTNLPWITSTTMFIKLMQSWCNHKLQFRLGKKKWPDSSSTYKFSLLKWTL